MLPGLGPVAPGRLSLLVFGRDCGGCGAGGGGGGGGEGNGEFSGPPFATENNKLYDMKNVTLLDGGE